MKNKKLSRRNFVAATSTISAGLLVGNIPMIGAPAIIKNYQKASSLIKGVQVGVITYSFRSMPDQSAEATLQYVLDSGINAIELMGGPAESFAGIPESSIDRRAFFRLRQKQRNGASLTETESKELVDIQAQMEAHNKVVAKWRMNAPIQKFEEVGKMYKDAGVSIYGFKPSAFGTNNTDAEIDYGFRAAKALGANHVTLEHPSNDSHTLKLGKMASKHRINVGYHGHEQQTPTFWDTALEQSAYNMLNIDIGHYVAAGNEEPLAILKKHHQRISSMHIKDRQTPGNGKENLPWGEGDTPIPEVLQLMQQKQYKFPATIELEYKIPEGSDAVKEVARCLGFCRSNL
ncbi:MAG: sugar phosphate isomerase/epimerase [Saprospiraceae bacterium]|jgi:sugar phosphate isomerase/epimerase